MTELSFLIELLLNHRLPKPTRDLVASRIKEVEASHGPSALAPPPIQSPSGITIPSPSYVQHATARPSKTAQSPSMAAKVAAMEAEEAAKRGLPPPPPVEVAQPSQATQPVTIAQTPIAVNAMNERNNLINKAINQNAGVFEKGSTGPMKIGGPRNG